MVLTLNLVMPPKKKRDSARELKDVDLSVELNGHTKLPKTQEQYNRVLVRFLHALEQPTDCYTADGVNLEVTVVEVDKYLLTDANLAKFFLSEGWLKVKCLLIKLFLPFIVFPQENFTIMEDLCRKLLVLL